MPELCFCCDEVPPEGPGGFSGSAVQRGFPNLWPSRQPAPAGRYIAAGWTGLEDKLTGDAREPGVRRALGLEAQPGDTHVAGESVLLRTAEATAVEYKISSLYGTTTAVPPASPWVVGAGTRRNTYISAGFWRSGVRNFVRGDVVFVCRPNALETDDDWCILGVFICHVDVTNAGDPRLDPGHFYDALRGTSGVIGVGHHFTQLLAATVTPVEPGLMTQISGEFYRVLQEWPGTGGLDYEFMEPYGRSRLLFEALTGPYSPAQPCRLTVNRWRELRFTAVAGAYGSFASAVRLNEAETGIELEQFDVMDDMFTAPALPSVGSVVVEYTTVTDTVVPANNSFNGGSYVGGVSVGAMPEFAAGDKARHTVITQASGVVTATVVTDYVCVRPEFHADAVVPGEFGAGAVVAGFIEDTGAAFVFEWIARAGRLMYPNVPGDWTILEGGVRTYETRVRAVRLVTCGFTESEHRWVYELVLAPQTLKTTRGGVLVGFYDRLETMALTQSAAVLELVPLPEPAATTATQSLLARKVTAAVASFLPNQNDVEVRVNRFNITLQGPRASRLLLPCPSGPQRCTNIPVPPGGLVHVEGIPGWGESVFVYDGIACV